MRREFVYHSFQTILTSWLKGKSVLELGSGTGLVGISAWAEGAFPTYLTDLPDALDITRVNVARNQERITHPRREDIHVQALTWGKLDPDVSTIKTPDFILGSDVIYIRESFDALIETLQTFCGLDTKILLAYKTRGLGETDFQDLAQKKGFVVQKVWFFRLFSFVKMMNSFLQRFRQKIYVKNFKQGDFFTLSN
ncbi:putative methyltransferase-domain-containing protein [Phlyctochytrium arcticum]|nr:putative methyltransferase-domain-containing protein [Phlyctochytrium arcticum]